MTFQIDSVDHAPDDLETQTPLRGRLLRTIAWRDRRGCWLAELDAPVSWKRDEVPRTVRRLALWPRWEGTVIASGASIPVGIAYVVTDEILPAPEALEPADAEYVAIGYARVAGPAIVDRPRREAAIAVVVTWLAFMIGLLAGGEIEGVASVAIAALLGAVLVFLGFAAVSRARRPFPRVSRARMRFLLLSLMAGAALGVLNLAANWAIAQHDPRLWTLLAERMATLEPMEGLIASPIVEEVMVRLFLMSVIAWLVFRVIRRAGLAFALALVGSALVFALLHLARPFPGDPELANFYSVTLVAKYTLAGVALGWIFWRWGLPYAIVCHIAANAAHLVLQRFVF